MSLCQVEMHNFSVETCEYHKPQHSHGCLKQVVYMENAGHPSASTRVWWAAAAPGKVILQICRCAVACRPSGEHTADITSLSNAAAWNTDVCTSNGVQHHSAEASGHVHSLNVNLNSVWLQVWTFEGASVWSIHLFDLTLISSSYFQAAGTRALASCGFSFLITSSFIRIEGKGRGLEHHFALMATLFYVIAVKYLQI